MRKKRMAPRFRAQHNRLAGGAPSSYSLRGALGSGYMYQFAARASPLILLLVDVWSLLAVSRANQVMATEVVAGALEVCDCQKTEGSVGQRPGSRASTQARGFNSAYDNVVGAHLLGIVENGPGDQVSMLRLTLGGTVEWAKCIWPLRPTVSCGQPKVDVLWSKLRSVDRGRRVCARGWRPNGTRYPKTGRKAVAQGVIAGSKVARSVYRWAP